MQIKHQQRVFNPKSAGIKPECLVFLACISVVMALNGINILTCYFFCVRFRSKHFLQCLPNDAREIPLWFCRVSTIGKWLVGSCLFLLTKIHKVAIKVTNFIIKIVLSCLCKPCFLLSFTIIVCFYWYLQFPIVIGLRLFPIFCVLCYPIFIDLLLVTCNGTKICGDKLAGTLCNVLI